MLRRAPAAVAALCLWSLSPAAQADSGLGWGGVGYLTQGWALGDLAGVGEDFGLDTPPGVGLTLGGGGFALLGGRVLLMGNGYGVNALDGQGLVADAGFTGGGGSFAVGVALGRIQRTLVAGYAGAAMHGADLRVTNGDDFATIGGVEMAPGERRAFDGGGLAVDVGATVFQLFWGDDDAGVALGGSMGVWIPVLDVGDDRGAVASTGAPSGVYFRMHLGGGGASRL